MTDLDPDMLAKATSAVRHERAYIAAANPATVLRLIDALEAVLELHVRAGYRGAFCLHCQSLNDGEWPCPTVAAITTALEEADDD